MSKISIIHLILLGIISTYTSCESNANVSVPATESKLVVTGFISPENNKHSFSFTMSEPIFNSNSGSNGSIENMIVTISDGTNNFIVPRNVTNGKFEFTNSEFPINYNSNYFLTLNRAGKISSASVQTISDVQPTINSIEVDSSTVSNEFGYQDKIYSVKVRWNDIPNETNYYRITGNVLYYFNGDTVRNSIGYDNVKSDKDREGGELKETLIYYGSGFSNEDIPIGFEVILLKVDEPYYIYYKNLGNYAGEDPFSEPVLIYTNIQNGLGIFCSYQTKKAVYLF